MDRSGFFYLDDRSLKVLELLETPVYIYGFSADRVVWANRACLEFWSAGSLPELHARHLPPFSTSTSAHLNNYLAAFRRGEQRTESCALYPKGVAVAATAHCKGVSLAGHDEAMLTEIRVRGQIEMPPSEVRAIEALRHIPSMVSMVGEDGAVLLRNPAALAFFSRHEGDEPDAPAAVEPYRELFADRADFDRLQEEVQQSGHSCLAFRTSEPSSPLHKIWLTHIVDPVTGKPATLWVQQDASGPGDRTLRLAASNEGLDVALSSIPAPSLLWSATSGRVLKANFAARVLLGIEVGGPSNGPAIFAESSARQNFLSTIDAKGNCTQSAQLIVDGERTFWAVVHGARLTVDDGQAVLLIISDIDKLQKVVAELEAGLEVERKVSATQRRFLEVASHEFRSHLAVIDSAAQRIARGAGKVPLANVVELTTRIRSFVSRLKGLLNQTIESAQGDLAVVRCESVRGRIQEAIWDVAKAFSDRADIEVDDEIGTIPEMWFDPIRIERVLINLFDNAIKYSPRRPRIRVSVVIGPNNLELYIRDWGIGILPEQREHVFAERARGANVGQLPGSGLGLFIVRSTVRAHGGEISVAETSGPGTTLKIILPFGMAKSQPATQGLSGV